MSYYWHEAEHQNLAQQEISILCDAIMVSLGEFRCQKTTEQTNKNKTPKTNKATNN